MLEKMNPLNQFLEEKIPGAPHFKWKEALWLGRLQSYVVPGKAIEKSIIKTAKKMESIRELIDKPIKVTSWYRPPTYNAMIKGALNSYHTKGLAVDFYVSGMKSDKVRELIFPHLTRFNIRMEDMPGSNWVHIDLGEVVNQRFFKP